MIRGLASRFFVLVLAGYSATSSAAETSLSPYQSADSGPVSALGEIFEREQFTHVGGEAVFLGDLFDENGNYTIPPGSTWKFVWKQLAPYEFTITEAPFEYLGGEDLCWSFGHCGALRGVTALLPYQCAPEQPHAIELYHDGTRVARHEFRPTYFNPLIVERRLSNESIAPVWPKRSTNWPAGSTGVYAEVTDTLNCGATLDHTVVRFESFIKPQTGAHTHFTDDSELGTGTFSSYVAGSVVSKDGRQVEAPINSLGRVGVFYKAGEFGLVETIKLTAIRDIPDEDQLIRSEEESIDLTIKIPDLREFTANDAPVIFVDGGSCPHSPLPHSFTQKSWSIMDTLAEAYYLAHNSRLSLNDGTLMLGGFMDNKLNDDGTGGGRDSGCHVSHRVGIDIDINKYDATGDLLKDYVEEVKDAAGNVIDTIEHECTPVTIEGISQCREDQIKQWVQTFGGRQIVEGKSIHYRLEEDRETGD